MKNTLLWLVFALGFYFIGVYLLPQAIDKSFANQDALIEQHIEFTSSHNPYE